MRCAHLRLSVGRGVEHTSSLRNYALRVAGLALLSELPYNLAMSGKLLDTTSRNPVFGLLVCLVMVYLYQKFPEKSASHPPPGAGNGGRSGLVLDAVHPVRKQCGRPLCRTVGVPGQGLVSEPCRFGSVHPLLPLLALLSGRPDGLLAVHFYNGEKGPENRVVNYLAYPALLLVVGAAGKLLF